MFLNVVIGTPLVAPEELLAFNLDDWNNNEKQHTYRNKIFASGT